MQISGQGAVIRCSLKDAFSLPVFILFTTMIGFGSLGGGAGFSEHMAWFSTVFIWGLPGQLAMVDMTSAGQNLLAIVVACSLANARFMPMVVSFLPWVNQGRFGFFKALLVAQMLSINSWAVCLREFPKIHRDWRRTYYLVFASSIIVAAVLGTFVGFYGAGELPPYVVLGFVFTSPLFFALVLFSTKGATVRWAMLFGCILIPLTSRWLPSVDLLVTGLVGGTAAFLINRRKSQS